MTEDLVKKENAPNSYALTSPGWFLYIGSAILKKSINYVFALQGKKTFKMIH